MEESEKVVFLGDDNPVTINTNQRARTKSENSIKQAKPKVLAQKDENVKEQQRLKRGQKSKLKKIKEKYKDQDEEEKKIRMEFIQVSFSQVLNFSSF